MQIKPASIPHAFQERLDERKKNSCFRYLQVNNKLIDFCSNDYLSFARSEKIKQKIKKYSEEYDYLSGSTGSRSISGNTAFAEELESRIASFHNAPAGLLFNSGYDANTGLFSCIAAKGDTLICDELIHASIIDGCRLSHAARFRFSHNDAADLEKKLRHAKGNVFVAVESVYSMDGDIAPLKEIGELCKNYGAYLIVDEAHATGVFGRQGKGMVNYLNMEDEVFARIHTFGKAMGSHGAIILGSGLLREYLINFSRSFIFTTALPFHSLISIRCAYEMLNSEDFNNAPLHELIKNFSRNLHFPDDDVFLISGQSAVQSIVIPGNERVRNVSRILQLRGFDVRAILSPSVPEGKERLRISLHLHNTLKEVDELKTALTEIVCTCNA